jgi:hypothetical protein
MTGVMATGLMPVALAFLHPWLLGFLALGSIPIIIHLLFRRRFRTVHWGAMEFLLMSDKETARRLKILQLLLLLTRIFILLIIVSALARPLITGALFAGFLGKSRASSTVILDNSYSMGLQQGNTTAYETAKDVAGEIAATFRKGDALSLMTVGPRPKYVTENAREQDFLARQIKATPLSDGGTDALAALTKCLERLKQSQQSHQEVFLVTDCRREGWRVEDTAGWERLNTLIEQCNPKPKIFIVDVSAPAQTENVYIESLVLPSAPPAVDRGYSVEVMIRTLDSPAPPAPVVTLYLDDDKLEAGRTKGSEFKDGLSTAKFVFRPKETGWHWGKVVIGPDALGPDNVRYFVYQVRDALNVLCLDGAPSAGPFESGMAFLRIALAPEKTEAETAAGNTSSEHTAAYASVSNIISPKVAPLSRFWEFDINQYPAIAITDAAGFSDRVAASLRNYDYSVGSLVLFLGESARPDEYLTLADPEMGRPLLPARITGFVGKSVEFDAPETPPAVRLSGYDYNHPVVRQFQDAKDGDLSAASFYKYAEVVVDETDPDVRVLLWFDNGDPYLIERRFGRGVVLLFTSSADLRWSNLPLKPVFLPLVHRLTYWLAKRGSTAHELTAGDEIRYPVPARLASAELQIQRAGGEAKVVRPVLAGIPGERGGTKLPTIVDDETAQAGIYRLLAPAGAGEEPGAHELIQTQFCVNGDPRESDLTPLSDKVLRSLFKATDVKYVKANEDVLGLIRTSRHGREIWRSLALVVCMLLMAESVLAHEIDKV